MGGGVIGAQHANTFCGMEASVVLFRRWRWIVISGGGVVVVRVVLQALVGGCLASLGSGRWLHPCHVQRQVPYCTDCELGGKLCYACM